jgi:YHS domain-containing protein
MPVDVKCAHCSNEFRSPIRKGRTYSFCSRACYWAANTGPRPDRVKLAPIACKQCGRPFQPRNASTRFCSRACAASYNHNPAQRGQGQTRRIACEACGTEFMRESVRAKFCSHSCYTNSNVGDRNHRFSGYLSKDRRGYLRYSSGHPEHAGKYVHSVAWHQANPGAGCADCGRAVEHVHHEDDNKANNELSNLTGLCANCHARRHALESGLGHHIR